MPRVSDAQRQRRREEILAAARRCFRRRGFHGTSMQDLFAEAQLSSGAVYLHFSSKDEIVLAIAEDNMSQLLGILRPELAAAADSGEPASSATVGSALAQAVASLAGEGDPEDDMAPLAVQVWGEAMTNSNVARGMTQLMEGLTGHIEELLESSGTHKVLGAGEAVEPEGRAEAKLVVALLAGLILQRALLGPDVLRSVREPLSRLFHHA